MDHIDAGEIESSVYTAIKKSKELLAKIVAAAQKCEATSADIKFGLECFESRARINGGDRRISQALIAQYFHFPAQRQDLGDLGRLHDLWEIMLQEETDQWEKEALQKELDWLKANSVRI